MFDGLADKLADRFTAALNRLLSRIEDEILASKKLKVKIELEVIDKNEQQTDSE